MMNLLNELTPDSLFYLFLVLGIGTLIAVVVIVWVLCRTLVVLFYGPPEPPKVVQSSYQPLPKVEPRQDCYDETNLTGKCLKPGGCKTDGECTRTIRAHDTGDLPLERAD